MGAIRKVSKWLVFIQNIIFFLLGAAVIGFGIYCLVEKELAGTHVVQNISIGVIVVGGVVLFISFFGCCGSVKENQCMLGFYWSLVFLMTVGAVVLVALSVTNTGKINDWLATAWNSVFTQAEKEWIYTNFHCCGFKDPSEDKTCPADPETKGCEEALVNWVKDHLLSVEIALGCIGGFFALGMLLTCCLICTIKKHKKHQKGSDHEHLLERY